MIPRSLLFFSIFLQATYGGPIFANYIRNSYFNQQEFPSSKRYEVNLDSLLIVLYEKKNCHGFQAGTWGKYSDNYVEGLVQCWNDISITNCRSCKRFARQTIRRFCPQKQGAIIWYDN